MTRITKAQREEEQKAKLRQRLMDLASGANSGCSLEGPDGAEGGFFYSMGPESFFSFVRAVESEFPEPDKVAIYQLWQLHHFAEIDSTVEHLWDRGIRP